MGKKWYTSKSIWAQVITFVSQAMAWAGISELQEMMVANPELAMTVAAGIQAVVAIVLRFVTKEPVEA